MLQIQHGLIFSGRLEFCKEYKDITRRWIAVGFVQVYWDNNASRMKPGGSWMYSFGMMCNRISARRVDRILLQTNIQCLNSYLWNTRRIIVHNKEWRVGVL